MKPAFKAMVDYVTHRKLFAAAVCFYAISERRMNITVDICDVCLSKRATDNLSEKSYEEVKRQILNLLSHSPLTPAETADQIKAEKEDIGQVIRYLLDEGELKMQDGMLHISK